MTTASITYLNLGPSTNTQNYIHKPTDSHNPRQHSIPYPMLQTTAQTPPQPKKKNKMDNDALSKETVGLPVFITSNQSQAGTVVTSDNPTSPSMSGNRRESVLSTKRLSQALDFAIASLDTLRKQAQNLLQDEPPRYQPTNDDLESGGLSGRRFGEGADGYKEWLD